MKIKYDRQVDILRITLKEAIITESDEETPGMILDFDENGNVVGCHVPWVEKVTRVV